MVSVRSRRGAYSEEPQTDREGSLSNLGSDTEIVQRASTRKPSGKPQGDIAEIPAPSQANTELKKFLTTMKPPQPHLQQVLFSAGIKDMDQLRFLARHQTSIETFLRELVSTKALSIFEYTYLTAALKGL
ncbi:hypothetical protein BDW22DRAFT_438618 [Trametopsis cervina]|nr:hypothetical protein BDW22DRAFT_438618 [Trametopsis cervina]